MGLRLNKFDSLGPVPYPYTSLLSFVRCLVIKIATKSPTKLPTKITTKIKRRTAGTGNTENAGTELLSAMSIPGVGTYFYSAMLNKSALPTKKTSRYHTHLPRNLRLHCRLLFANADCFYCSTLHTPHSTLHTFRITFHCPHLSCC